MRGGRPRMNRRFGGTQTLVPVTQAPAVDRPNLLLSGPWLQRATIQQRFRKADTVLRWCADAFGLLANIDRRRIRREALPQTDQPCLSRSVSLSNIQIGAIGETFDNEPDPDLAPYARAD